MKNIINDHICILQCTYKIKNFTSQTLEVGPLCSVPDKIKIIAFEDFYKSNLGYCLLTPLSILTQKIVKTMKQKKNSLDLTNVDETAIESLPA